MSSTSNCDNSRVTTSPPLHVFGDAAKFRTRLRSLLKQGDDLLARIDAIETTHAPSSGVGLRASLDAILFESEIGRRVSDWDVRVWRALRDYLGNAAPKAVLKPPSRDKTDRSVKKMVEQNRHFIRTRQDDLRGLIERVPGRRIVQSPSSSQPDLGELRRTRLVDPKVLDGYSRRMSKFKTVHQRAEAIGASKELLEATYRGVLDLVSQPYANTDDYPALAKKVRVVFQGHPDFLPTGGGSQAVTKLLSGFGQLSNGIAEMRNNYGTGHGKTRHPVGLEVRHARLAVDIAVAECRFVALTANDLGLLTGT